MVVDLGQRRAMAAIALLADLVRLDDCLMNLRHRFFHPGKQRWANVKADLGIVIGDLLNLAFAVHDQRRGIGRVALHRHPFVPVVIR